MRVCQSRRWTDETLGQGCGIFRAGKYHRGDAESPGLKLCAEGAGVVGIALEFKGALAGGAGGCLRV